jgi:hypothetical protein
MNAPMKIFLRQATHDIPLFPKSKYQSQLRITAPSNDLEEKDRKPGL